MTFVSLHTELGPTHIEHWIRKSFWVVCINAGTKRLPYTVQVNYGTTALLLLAAAEAEETPPFAALTAYTNDEICNFRYRCTKFVASICLFFYYIKHTCYNKQGLTYESLT